MAKPIVYIAGPFRGANAWDVECNIRRAEITGLSVAEQGAIPLIPHTMYRFWDGTLDDSFWLACGIELLRKCDAVMLCPGWRRSKGTLAERAEAERLKLPIFDSADGGHSLLYAWMGARNSTETGE